MTARILIFAVIFTSTLRAQITPAEDAPQPLTPSESLAKARLPEGFRMELVASEPVVTEPSAIAFDEHGSMFVCELHGYNIEGHIDTRELNKTGKLDTQVRRLRWELMGGAVADEAARNQFGVLKKLVDSDGDGIMDKANVWADDLPPCYGVVPARGGIIVTCAPHIMFFADRDGDGMPDERQTLFTGFDIRVLERGINNPIWGLDNWIYVGSGGEGGTITGPNLAEPFKLGRTDFRIRADGSAIEPVNGRVGTFGMTMNDVGDRFPSSGGRPAIYALPLPYRYLARNPFVAMPGTNHTAADYNRGFRISEPHPWRVARGKDPEWIKFYGAGETNSNYFSGGCSTTYYGDSLFPAEFHGNLFYCEPSLNIVHRTVLRRDGAGYVAERAPKEQTSEFLASTDQWFRPMNLRIGPDGALYIVDMYREIIEDYSAIPRFLQQQYGLDKGKNYGRIWRLLPDDATKRTAPDFSNAEALTRALNDHNPWRRRTAQRLLIERQSKSVQDALAKLIAAKSSTASGKIAAIYTLGELELLSPEDVRAAQLDDDYRVRIHGLRLMQGEWLKSHPDVFAKWFALVDDPDPSVRLQFALTLGDINDDRATSAMLTLAQRCGEERWMSAALLSSSNTTRAGDLLKSILELPDISAGARSMIAPLAQTVSGRQDSNAMASCLEIMTTLETPLQVACLSGFAKELERKNVSHFNDQADWTALLTPFFQNESSEIVELAIRLSAHLPLQDRAPLQAAFAAAAQRALDRNADVETRQRSLRLLSNAEFDTIAKVTTSLLDATQQPAVQSAAISALSRSDDPKVAAVLLQCWPSLSPDTRETVLKTLLERENRTPALLEAIEDGTVHRGDLSSVQQDQLIGSADLKVAKKARQIFKTENVDAALQTRLDLYQKALTGPRDLHTGEQVFTQACLVCHQLNGKGNQVGPDLGGIVTQPDELILLNILDPGSKIDPEYKLYLVTTSTGQTFAGVLSTESPTSITLRIASGEEDVILRENITSMTASEVSLMPANFHSSISPQDMASLIGFMRKSFAEGKPDTGK